MRGGEKVYVELTFPPNASKRWVNKTRTFEGAERRTFFELECVSWHVEHLYSTLSFLFVSTSAESGVEEVRLQLLRFKDRMG